MTDEQKAQIRHVGRMLAGFCSHDAPEILLVQLIDELVEGNYAEALHVSELGATFISEFEEETNDEDLF